MKTHRRPFRPWAAALLAVALGAWAPVHAQQGVDLSLAQPDFTSWTLYGSATAQNLTPGNGFTYSLLQLTQEGSGSQAGAGFSPTPLALDFNDNFDFRFVFFLPSSTGVRGDGLTLTLAAAPGLGSTGSGLGYEGLDSASVALAFDTFHFDGEPVSPSVQILAGGSSTPLAATATGLDDSIRGARYAWLAELAFASSGNGDQAGTLTGTVGNADFGSFTVSADVDFAALGMAGAPVYWGFTAANGLATDGHTVFWGAPVAAVPEPAAAWLMLAGAAAMVAWRRRAYDARHERFPAPAGR